MRTIHIDLSGIIVNVATAHRVLQIDFPDGHICIFRERRPEEIVYTVYSLIFGEPCSPLRSQA